MNDDVCSDTALRITTFTMRHNSHNSFKEGGIGEERGENMKRWRGRGEEGERGKTVLLSSNLVWLNHQNDARCIIRLIPKVPASMLRIRSD